MKRWRRFAATACGWIAAAFLAAMMLLTVADVVARAVFNTPIRGTLEVVELLLAWTFFLALPAVFLRDEHIVVDVVDGFAPLRVPLLKRCAEALAVVVLAVMGWQSWILAGDALAFGDVTSDLSLPRILYWIPVLAGILGSAAAALVMALRGDRGR
ncbi:MAG TPA: TRAP transporter small permease [Burkholderiales bacterium]|nr:TRAP transporter small permease [Burkholderiales bacterium]